MLTVAYLFLAGLSVNTPSFRTAADIPIRGVSIMFLLKRQMSYFCLSKQRKYYPQECPSSLNQYRGAHSKVVHVAFCLAESGACKIVLCANVSLGQTPGPAQSLILCAPSHSVSFNGVEQSQAFLQFGWEKSHGLTIGSRVCMCACKCLGTELLEWEEGSASMFSSLQDQS